VVVGAVVVPDPATRGYNALRWEYRMVESLNFDSGGSYE
jgi:hypothetical protein